jgi:ribosomal protein L11 methylase PrmA
MTVPVVDGASFRDRRARVFEQRHRILRVLNDEAAEEFYWLNESGLLSRFVDDHWLVRTFIPDDASSLRTSPNELVIEHERIPFISYPYEWPFSALKKAALRHLEIHRAALAAGATLIDASAYNIQFHGCDPIFIDVPSLRRYLGGEYWLAHQQFLDQFLNPLLYEAKCNVDFQSLYRGTMEGISTSVLSQLLRPWHKLRPSVLMQVVLPATLQRAGNGKSNPAVAATVKRRPFAKSAYIGMIDALARLIRSLVPRRPSGPWTGYANDNSYSGAEFEAKRKFISEYSAKTRPRLMLDLGCNTGAFSEAALKAGAAYVVGAEQDAPTADLAFNRAERTGLPFLPLVIDLANPSPDQGWRSEERRSFSRRTAFDGMIALAVEHHLAIGRNIPLDSLIEFMVGLAPHGVIEFVPKSDPQVQRLLALREDVFPDYTQTTFESLLHRMGRVVQQETITETGRTLYWYERGFDA